MTNLNKEQSKFCRFSSIQRPSTTQKRFQKYCTQPSLCQNNHLSLNHLSDDFLIEKLKTVFYGQDKPIYNNCCQEIFNVPSPALKSYKANKQEGLVENSTVNSSMKPRQVKMLNYQVDSMHLQRGLKDERIYYKKLLVQLNQIGRAIPNAGLSCTQKFELKKKYLQEYLYTFFRQLGRECNQKSLYIQKLWESMKQIFQTLIQKLIQEIKSNEKNHLLESHSMHIKYQQKFEEFQTKISQKNQEIEKFKQIISKLSLKNWKKSKKNREISQGIVQIVGKLDIVQKQRDYLQSEYVNMLTLGYQGGMEYEQAKKFTLTKFNIQKQAKKQREKQEIRNYQKQNKQQKKKHKKQKKCVKKSIQPQKLYKMKQKYIYGPSRNREMSFEDNSDEQFYSNIGLKNFNKKVYKKVPQKTKSSDNNINFQLIKDDEDNMKTFLNKRIQTVQMFCSPPKIQKQCRQTNFGIIQKYRDNFIRNKEIQTEPSKTKRPNCYNCASQYDEEDFLNNQNCSDKIKQQSLIQEPVKNVAEEYTIKWMRLQKEKNQYKSRDNVEQQPQCIKQKNSGQVKDSSPLQNKQAQQQQLDMKIEEKKMKRNNPKVMNKSNHYKKSNRPSIFKRNSLVGAQKRISLVDRVQKIQEIGNKNRIDKIIDKNNYIQEQESQIYSKNSIRSIKKQKQTEKNPRQSQTNFLKSYVQMERGEQAQADHQSDYYTTDMLSVLKNMSKLTPKGIYIDQTMLFLLKKSLFKIKHDTCDNVFNQNYQFIIKARQSVCGSKNTKNNVGGVKNFMKIIGSTYDLAFLRLYKKNKQLTEQNQNNLKGVKGQKNKVRHDSFRSTMSKSHRRTQSNLSNIPISELNFDEEEQTKINLVSLMRESIKKQYPLYKTQQIENKIISLLKSISHQRNSNYQLKNFMLLSCFEENIFSTVIFDNDIEFYFALLLELNIGNSFDNFQSREDRQKEIGQKSYKLSNSNGSYQNCFTNIKKLKWGLPIFIKKHYKKQSLVTFIQHRISDTLQKIRGKQNMEACEKTRLDIFKCSQLIMQSLFSFKLDILKSFAQLTELPCLSPNNLISQQLLIDILGFIKMSKLEILNTVNKFRYDYGKNNTIEGINLIYMVNFCIKHNLPDFDEVLYDVLRRYPTSIEIQNKIATLKMTYPKFSKLQNICLYLHSKNLHYFNTNLELKDQTNHKQIETEIQFQEQAHQQIKNNPSISTNAELKNHMKDSTTNFSLLDKQLWDIIGVKASNCLIHCKVVQLQSSQLLEYILGENLITIYMASLCQLQEKKYLIKKSD